MPLFIGGPCHGQLRELPDNSTYTVYVTKPVRLQDVAPTDVVPYDKESYHAIKIPYKGKDTTFMVWENITTAEAERHMYNLTMYGIEKFPKVITNPAEPCSKGWVFVELYDYKRTIWYLVSPKLLSKLTTLKLCSQEAEDKYLAYLTGTEKDTLEELLEHNYNDYFIIDRTV